jgi:hypothetical protein
VILVMAVAACVAVAGERIRVADVAKAVGEFGAAPAEETVAFTPAPWARRVLSPGELKALAQRFSVAYAPGPPVCFERKMEPLTLERVLQAVRAAGGEGLVDFTRNRVPEGTLEFTPGRGELWRGVVRYAPNRSVPVWARVRVAAAVERGDAVQVEARSGEARAAIEARAERAGRVGDTIVLRREDNGRRLLARVTGKGRATIDANRSVSSSRASGGGR